jgi:hypothetical protein
MIFLSFTDLSTEKQSFTIYYQIYIYLYIKP